MGVFCEGQPEQNAEPRPGVGPVHSTAEALEGNDSICCAWTGLENSWVKIKNPTYSQAIGQDELFQRRTAYATARTTGL
jgi:hypothetical protein